MTEKNNPDVKKQPSEEMQLMHMIHGSRITQLIYVAAKLRIADLLDEGPKNTQEIAQIVGAHPRALYRVMRALSGLGIFSEDEVGYFHMTQLAKPLKTGVPDSLAGYAIMVGEPWSWSVEGELLYSVRTGKPAFAHVHGMDVHDYMNRNIEVTKQFNEAMTSFSSHELEPILNAYDFSQHKTVVDVGGGHGALLAEILKINPEMQGKLFDLRAADEAAISIMEKQGVRKRCELVPGNFFRSAPGGGDAYIFKRVIHDWDDDNALAILKVCHKAMSDKSRLLIIERLITIGNEPSFGKLVDISMLTISGGLERSEPEFRMIIERAGFKITNIIQTRCPLSIIEAMPVY